MGLLNNVALIPLPSGSSPPKHAWHLLFTGIYPPSHRGKQPTWGEYEPFEEDPDSEDPQSQRQGGQEVAGFGVLHPGSWIRQIRPGYVVWQPKPLVPEPGWESSHVCAQFRSLNVKSVPSLSRGEDMWTLRVAPSPPVTGKVSGRTQLCRSGVNKPGRRAHFRSGASKCGAQWSRWINVTQAGPQLTATVFKFNKSRFVQFCVIIMILSAALVVVFCVLFI